MLVRLSWDYSPSQFDREMAEEWIEASDLNAVCAIAVAENSLTMVGFDETFVSVNRSWDLVADLVEAAMSLRDDIARRQGSSSTG
jgi:hypothetical protein